MMDRYRPIMVILAALVLGLGACGNPTGRVDELRAVDIAWSALDPNTSSHSLANWEVVESRQVGGREVADEFSGRPAPGCLGPTPPPSEPISDSASYWIVRLRARPTTPRAGAPAGPTAPPAIPEPLTRQAAFLVDIRDGHIVARKLACVIY